MKDDSAVDSHKRRIGEVENEPNLPKPPKIPRMEGDRSQTEYTIPLQEWEAYLKREDVKMGKHFSHTSWQDLKALSRDNRMALITDIQAITGVEHKYYLCIPVEKRPKGTLPLDPKDCSTNVLKAIRDILVAWTGETVNDGEKGVKKAEDANRREPGHSTTTSAIMNEQTAAEMEQQINATPSRALPGSFPTPESTPNLPPRPPPAPTMQKRQPSLAPDPPSNRPSVRGSHEDPISISDSPPRGVGGAGPGLARAATPSSKFYDEEVAKAQADSDLAWEKLAKAKLARETYRQRRGGQ